MGQATRFSGGARRLIGLLTVLAVLFVFNAHVKTLGQGTAVKKIAKDSGIDREGGLNADRRSDMETGLAPQRRFPPTMPFLKAVATCDTLECLRDAHMQPREGARFNFPHLIIVGWQKSATTSVYAHLLRHKGVMRPDAKEPEFFSDECDFTISKCDPERVKIYIHKTLNLTDFVKEKGNMLPFEASTHYVRGGDRMASDLYLMFPWVKVLVLLREPISRAMSMLIHRKDASNEGCLTNNSMAYCLMHESQISGDFVFPDAQNYSTPLKYWLRGFPAGQVMALQYEDLVYASDGGEGRLRQVKRYIGLDLALPKDGKLPVRNMRKDTLGTEGWPMKRSEYEKLVEMVRPDCERVAEMVGRYGLGNGEQWMQNWNEVWENNLETCTDKGKCTIHVS